jgi:hypothetical protein
MTVSEDLGVRHGPIGQADRSHCEGDRPEIRADEPDQQ